MTIGICVLAYFVIAFLAAGVFAGSVASREGFTGPTNDDVAAVVVAGLLWPCTVTFTLGFIAYALLRGKT